MQTYVSHKQVKAARILGALPDAVIVEDAGNADGKRITVDPKIFSWYQPVTGDYLVQYEDGYLSISPRKAFEEGYTPRDTAGSQAAARHFGEALFFLKRGGRVARRGWNGQGMFLFLVNGSRFNVNRAPLLGIYPEGTTIDYHAHIDMKTAQGYVVPWVASQADLLADDWMLLDEEQAEAA